MPVPDSLSRIVEREGSAPFAFVAETNRTLTVGEFAADIAACADSLPSSRFAINVCTNRYRFAVAFFAAATRGQINLLPSRRDAAALDALRRDYGSSVTLSDQPADSGDAAVTLTPGGHGTAAIPELSHAQLTAIVFTSGSTGAPRPHAKTWGLLDHFRTVHWRYLRRSLGVAPHQMGLVATVPPWHMYGMEWSLLLPTVAPVTLHCGADFFPHDVTAALSRFDLPTVLVATPTHLRALLTSAPPTKPVAATLSATAPLSDDLASQVEAFAGGRLVEIYGASEIGSLAIRHPLGEDAAWRFFDCFDVAIDNGRLTVTTPHLPEPVTLQDRFEQTAQQGFVLRGRATDVVKVGGKRESLANLNAALLAIPGVEDGLVYDPERVGMPATGRLGAIAVAPELDARSIRAQLAQRVDSAFVPRTIRLVPALPRDDTSKLALRALRQLLADANLEQAE